MDKWYPDRRDLWGDQHANVVDGRGESTLGESAQRCARLIKHGPLLYGAIEKTPAEFALDISDTELRKILAPAFLALQKAQKKWPEWTHVHCLFPDPTIVEQSSGPALSSYKLDCFPRNIETIHDLTGGLGADSFTFAKRFKVCYVEPNPERLLMAMYNAKQLNRKALFFLGTAEDYLKKAEINPKSAFFIDPDRRVNHQKSVSLEDSLPNTPQLWEDLTRKFDYGMVKCSPLADLKSLWEQCPGSQTLHIVSQRNECKEIVVEYEKGNAKAPSLLAVDIIENQTFSDEIPLGYKGKEQAASPVGAFLFEPNASLRKAHALPYLMEKHGLNSLGPQVALLTGDSYIAEWPGRVFRIVHETSPKAKAIKKIIGSEGLSVITKNYPETSAKLFTKIGAKAGTDKEWFLIALRNRSGKKALLCRKMLEHGEHRN